RHTRCLSDWSSDVCSSDLEPVVRAEDDVDERAVAARFGQPRCVLDVGGEAGLRHRLEGLLQVLGADEHVHVLRRTAAPEVAEQRSEERRVGKGWRYWRGEE